MSLSKFSPVPPQRHLRVPILLCSLSLSLALAALLLSPASLAQSGHEAKPFVSYSLWQLSPSNGGVWEATFSHGLLVVQTQGATGTGPVLTAYRESTGTVAWSLSLGETELPEWVNGSLFVDNWGLLELSRYDPATGVRTWTSDPIEIPGVGSEALHSSTLLPRARGRVFAEIFVGTLYVSVDNVLLYGSNGVTRLSFPSEDTIQMVKGDFLVTSPSSTSLEQFNNGRLRVLWHNDGSYFCTAPTNTLFTVTSAGLSVASLSTGRPVGEKVKTSGAHSVGATTQGIVLENAAQHYVFLGTQGKVIQGPAVSQVEGTQSISGGILWSYSNDNPVVHALSPESFAPLGKLVTTSAQFSVEGNDAEVASDGQYAAIFTSPIVYVFRL
jgi:hypothetical protein